MEITRSPRAGAGRGMGTEIARAALAASDALVATARNTGTVTVALGKDDDLLAVKLDVTDRADAEAAVQPAAGRFRVGAHAVAFRDAMPFGVPAGVASWVV
jgi:NAD(P)-dependent dehydrogenase (short-subunit alcohol dehydrogenase family)